MIYIDENKDIITRGVFSSLREIYEIVGDKQEVVKDIIGKKLIIETEKENNLQELFKRALDETTQVTNNAAKKYLDYLRKDKKRGKYKTVIEKLISLESNINSKLETMLSLLTVIAESQYETVEHFSLQTWIDLKEIAKDLKQIYTLGTLRNKIKKEVRAGQIYGHLKIKSAGIHLILLKKGKKWVTHRKAWDEEKEKLHDYDVFRKLKNDVKKYIKK